MQIDPEVLGKIQNYFFTHRILHTKPVKGRQRKEGEKEIVDFIKHELMETGRAYLEDLFSAQGFLLKIFDGAEYQGIPIGGQVWCIVRSPNLGSPGWVSARDILPILSVKTNESKQATIVWSFTVYIHYLILAYTRINRHPNEISRYNEAIFTKEELVVMVRKFIDKIAESKSCKSEVAEILTEEKGKDIERRTSKVLDWLCNINHLEYSKIDGGYAQTILGAAEAYEHYDCDLRYLVPPDEESVSGEDINVIIEDQIIDNGGEE